MLGIGSIIGGALQVGGAIFGGVKAAKEAKKQAAILSQQKADNQAWYNKRYNEDATQRADSQRAIQMARDAMQQRYQQATASAAVTGATDESVAAQKAAANQTLANITSNIAAQGDAQKAAIEQQYMNTNTNLANQQIGVSQNKANNIINAVGGASNALGTAGAGVDKIFGK